jgi:hypothetical protein
MSDDALFDKDVLISTSIVKAIDSFSKINKVVLACRNKPLTEAKQEDIGREISNILFYSGCLVYLRELAGDGFDVDSLKEYAESYEDIYQNDAIMCSMSGMSNLVDLSQIIYADPLADPTEELEEELSTPSVDPGVEGINSNVTPEIKAKALKVLREALAEAEAAGADIEYSDDELGEEEMCLVSVFASCFLLCGRLELDFENLIYNAKLIEKI